MPAAGYRATHCKNGHAFTLANTRLQKKGKYTYQSCRACARAAYHRQGVAHHRTYLLRYRYGLTPQQRSDILVSQDGLCALCYERPAVVIDHDHETGRVRGMLCKACNSALGVIGDQPHDLETLTEYLTRDDLAEVV